MSQLRILDYRNAKYQGSTYKYSRNGLGMLIDDQFTLIITLWNKNVINGPTVIVYPQNVVFFGHFQNGHPEGFSVFQLENQVNLYCVFKCNGEIQEKVVIVMEKAGILAQAIVKQSAGNANGRIDSQWNEVKSEEIKLISDQTFKDQETKFKLIEETLNMKIPKSSFKASWIYYLDQELLKPNPGQIHLVQSHKNRAMEWQIGYKKGQTIGGCFTQGSNPEPVSIGFYKNEFIFKDLGRKYISSASGKIIQEGIYNSNIVSGKSRVNTSTIFTYHQINQARPPQVGKAIQNYFRQSLTFINQFVNLKNVYKTVNICFKVGSALLQSTAERYAQVQLQLNGSRLQKDPQVLPPNQQRGRQNPMIAGVYRQFTLEQVKTEVYEAVKKRSKSGKVRPHNISTESPGTSSRRIVINLSPAFESPHKQNKYKQEKDKKYSYQPPQVKYGNRDANANYQSPEFKKSSEKNRKLLTPERNRYLYTPERGGSNRSQKSPNRYRYVPGSNFTDLTRDYQNIQKQILRETPRASKKKNNFMKHYVYNEGTRDISKSRQKAKKNAFNYIY